MRKLLIQKMINQKMEHLLRLERGCSATLILAQITFLLILKETAMAQIRVYASVCYLCVVFSHFY